MTVTNQLNRIVDFLFGRSGASEVAPTTYYIGLATGDVSTSGTVTGEISGGNYARVSVTNSKDSFTAGDGGALSNKITIAFNQSSTSWGQIKTVFVADAATGGNVLYYATLSPTKLVQALATVQFDPGQITFTASN